MKTVIIGAGAVGGCLGGWLSETYDDVYLMDQGAVADNLRKKGLTLYKQNEESAKKKISVKVINSLDEVKNIDLIIMAVKNYSLEALAKSVKEKIKGSPLILTLQNGISNQEILPKYFDRVVYGIIEFNAWIDEPCVIGYQNKGPFVLGATKDGMDNDVKALSAYMGKAVETHITGRIRNAAYCKMVINLTNSYATLVGHKYREIENISLFKKVLSNSMYEGIKILKAAGIAEFKVDNMPSWSKIKASATLPDFITMKIFKKNLDKMVLSSMAQDILQRKSGTSELDSLLGHFVGLAEKYNVSIPYNKTVYDLCKREFAKPEFKPMTETEVWNEVKKKL